MEGQTWSVARPLRDAAVGDSRAALAEDCLSVAGEVKETPGFAEFVRCVEKTTTGDIPDIPLPNVGRPVRWLDLLGWLARDHECRYRVYNEWREPDAASGTGKLLRDDASFLLRLAMGLVQRRGGTAHRRPQEAACRFGRGKEEDRPVVAVRRFDFSFASQPARALRSRHGRR